jgi:alanine racemase
MIEKPSAPMALALDSAALKANWQWLAQKSGPAACGAAIKANAYGLGAIRVLDHLKAAGCRDFFVATWREAAEVLPYLDGASLSVFHGVREEDMAFALNAPVRPVLNSPEQIARWKAANGGPCDIMIDTGMNRLGLDANDVKADLFEGLQIETLMSHLACADEPNHQLNMIQPMILKQMSRRVGAKRLSLANSAGIMAGESFLFDLTRPGLSLYGGIQRSEGAGHIRQVVTPRAQIIQRRTIRGGESVGYGATYVPDSQRDAAIINIGYADGYFRGFSNMGSARRGDLLLPIMGRVSMDLVTIDISNAPDLKEGDWLDLDFDLPTASAESGMSQYELLTSLNRRFLRDWY